MVVVYPFGESFNRLLPRRLLHEFSAFRSGIPAFFFYLLRRYRRRMKEPGVRVQLGFLFEVSANSNRLLPRLRLRVANCLEITRCGLFFFLSTGVRARALVLRNGNSIHAHSVFSLMNRTSTD